jgi:porin
VSVMKSQRFLIVFAACLATSYGLARSAVAQTATSDQETKAEKPDSTTSKDAQAKDAKPKGGTNKFGGDLWTREKLTGDWGGVRTDLHDHGIDIDLRLIQYFQGVAKGGSNTNFAYGGKIDLILDLDGHKMGLWEGLMINVHAESQFGDSIIDDAGGMTLYNPQMYYPLPDSHDVAVTHVLFLQFLSKKFAFALGKINVLDFVDMIYPARGAGVEGFSNLNVLYPALPWFRWVNLSFLATGPVFLTEDEQVQGGVFALDLNNVTTTTGIPEVFDDGAGILGFWRFFFDVKDNPGSLLLIAGGSTREYHSFESTDSGAGWENEGIIAELQKAANNKDDGVWSAAILYDQVLWEEPANDKQNLRFVAGLSVSDGDPSFSKVGGMASLEATGLLFDREKDRAGVGGFYSTLSSDFKKDMDRVGVDLRDLWGVELYYNAEITPWFHLTPSMQVIQNSNDSDDPAVIVGLRGVISF